MNSNNNKAQVLIGGAVVVRSQNGKEEWLLIRQTKEGDWELPKTVVRKGESSVRAVLRIIGEKGGMTTRVLEEAGRAGGATTVGEKTVPQRQIYYLMLFKSSAGEAIGFEDSQWNEYSSAQKKLASKREATMLTQARDTYKEWKKAREKKRRQE